MARRMGVCIRRGADVWCVFVKRMAERGLSEKERSLMEGAQRGNYEGTESVLDEEVDVNVRDWVSVNVW